MRALTALKDLQMTLNGAALLYLTIEDTLDGILRFELILGQGKIWQAKCINWKLSGAKGTIMSSTHMAILGLWGIKLENKPKPCCIFTILAIEDNKNLGSRFQRAKYEMKHLVNHK